MEKTEDYMEMAQLSLQAGLTAEALRVIEQGYKAGALGTGPEAARHQRLRDLAVKRDAEVRAKLPELASRGGRRRRKATAWSGSATPTPSMGEADTRHRADPARHRQGRPEAPRRRQAAPGHGAAAVAPRPRAPPLQTLRSVKGSDGAADIARLWTVLGAP